MDSVQFDCFIDDSKLEAQTGNSLWTFVNGHRCRPSNAGVCGGP